MNIDIKNLSSQSLKYYYLAHYRKSLPTLVLECYTVLELKYMESEVYPVSGFIFFNIIGVSVLLCVYP